MKTLALSSRCLRIPYRLLRCLFLIFAFYCLFLLIFSFTTGPFWLYYSLGTKNSGMVDSTGYIVLLGGSGMPGKSALMRTYYTHQLAERYPDASIIIALPGDPEDAGSSLREMKQELCIRGTDTARIRLEHEGRNTRGQCLQLKKKYPGMLHSGTLLVTAPEHMYRSIRTFRKAGFENIGGVPAFEKAIESDIHFEDDSLGGRTYVPPVGKSIQLRYQFWNHLHYEILIMREYMALAYYKLKGWI